VRTLVTHDQYGLSSKPREAGHHAGVVAKPAVTV
jgi:hypothetical protein